MMFYYYGAKHQMARHYQPPHFPTVVEPFAGAAGYSMLHLPNPGVERIVLIDKDPRVIALWDRLLGMSPNDIEKLPRPVEGEYTSDFLIVTAAASNAAGGLKQLKVTPRVVRVYEGMLRRIARILAMPVLDKIETVEGDYTDAPDIEATWFIDPPYIVTERTSKTARPQGMGYAKHCTSADLDYEALAKWCKGRRGQVVVCEQEGAEWLPFQPLRRHQSSNGSTYKEVVFNA